MIELRRFLNDDSPSIAAIWNSQPPLRGRLDKLTPLILEQFILSKPYFDPRGLIVACDAAELVGFVHAGFAPSHRSGELEREHGIISMLMVLPRSDAAAIAGELLTKGEEFLKGEGAQVLVGGGCGVRAPFYLGLYGGCRLPGVLSGDTFLAETLTQAGYQQRQTVTIWQRPLAGFRPPMDRDLLALRRQLRLQPVQEDPVLSWGDTCAYTWSDPLHFSADSLATGQRTAALTFWNMEPLASNWGQRAMGLADYEETEGDDPRNGLPAYCLGEALRQFQAEGVGIVEVQTGDSNVELAETCKKLGLNPIDRGIQFSK